MIGVKSGAVIPELDVLVLLLGTGSVTPEGATTLATLVMVEPVPAVPVKVKVRLPPLGNVGIAKVPACKAAKVGFVGQTAPPVAVPQVKIAAVKLATTGSLTVAPLAADGPLLVMTSVYVTLPPGVKVAGPVLMICKSATGLIVVLAVLTLLPGEGSVTPAGGVTVTVLAIVPVVPAVPVKVNTRLPPLGKVGMVRVPDCRAATVGPTGQTAPPEAVPHVSVVAVKLTTEGSLTVVLLAASGPLFVMMMVYVTDPFAFTVIGPVLTTAKSVDDPPVITVEVLLPSVGSITPAGGVVVATFVMVEPVPAVPVKVRVTLPPLGKVGIASVPACKAAKVGLAGQTAPPVAVPQVTPLAVKLATTGSLTVAPLAADGPLLVITRV